MPDIKVVIHIRIVSFHVGLNAYTAISYDNLYFRPHTLNMFHAPFKSFSFHSIAAGHFTNLNYLKINYLVSDLINHGVGAIFCTGPWAITMTIPREPQILALQIIEYSVLFLSPNFINYWK